MLNVVNHSTNPYFNLAAEEFLFSNFATEDIFMLWRNEPTVVIGRFQNTLEEIHREYVHTNKIHVVRRLSGGGAVYHDLGNINFTLIKRNVTHGKIVFEELVQPLIETLSAFGVEAKFTGRNDITIDNRKFSGNAQYITANGLLHHGTILFDSDFSKLTQCLHVKEQKYVSKGVKSLPSRVTNVKEFLKNGVDIDVFSAALTKEFVATCDCRQMTIVQDMQESIDKLVDERYGTWEWNYGGSPKYSFRQDRTFAGGTVTVFLQIDKGLITDGKIYGDFFAYGNVEDIIKAVTGKRHDPETIRNELIKIGAETYFHSVSQEELVGCFFA